MAPRLVNTAPGESLDAVKPGQFAHLGLKSELLKVPLASALVDVGLTNVTHHSLLPESDTTLTHVGAEITLETSERRRPITGTTPHSIVAGDLVLTKSGVTQSELGIYEVKMPIVAGSSCLAFFKFRTKTTWNPFVADWCNLSNMTGMYFGLEHGTFNTACYAFLRANTVSGSMVVGGPLQAYNAARPGQVEILPGTPHAATPGFAWRSLPNNSLVEVYIYFNILGYSSAPLPGVPTNVPLVEIWTKIPTDPSPVVQAYLAVGTLGIFPSSLANPAFTNSRSGPSDTATIFFGNIASTGGSDTLEIVDWSFFPDFRVAVKDGTERPDHSFLVSPDAPVEYKANTNKTPFELVPGRWFPETGAGWLSPNPVLFFQPGRRGQAIYTSMVRSQTGYSAIHKTEPRFEERQDGIMVEAFMSGEVSLLSGDGTGMGFSVEDGSKLYQVSMVETAQRKFYSIVKDLLALNIAANGYHAPAVDADFTSLKMVRLLIDRCRPAGLGGGKAQLVIDDQVVLTKSLAVDTFPASSSAIGMVRFGHLNLPTARGKLNFALINYAPRYLAWEGVDLLLPDDAGLNARVKFTIDANGIGSSAMVGNTASIVKSALGGTTRRTYVKTQSLAEVDGMYVDFQVKIDQYADLGGASFAPNSQTGVTLTAFLGNKKVEIGFYDCGIYGRKIAILPSSGSVSDIINQTALGKPLSASIDWTQLTSYRLIVKGHDRIELIIGSPTNPPAITLPWRDNSLGFDLPPDVSTPRLVFGHSDINTTSTSKWGYVRWGLSNGFETAVQQRYPNGYPKYLFGGKILIKSDFNEA